MKNLLIKPTLNVKDALKQLNKVGAKCLVVVSKENKLLGTLSDGDVRRAILKGKYPKNKISEFYQKNSIFLKKGNYSISQAKDIFMKKRIDIIPSKFGINIDSSHDYKLAVSLLGKKILK